MSQKYAIGIVATSFVAGLLATAMVFGPREWIGVDLPSFSFTAEPFGGSRGNQPASPQWWQILESRDVPARPAGTDRMPPGWPSWKKLAAGTRGFFQRHFGREQPATTDRLATATARQQLARLPQPPDPFSMKQTGGETEVSQGRQSPDRVVADSFHGLLSGVAATATDGTTAAAPPARGPLPLAADRQPRPMTLTHDEMASLERLARRAGPGDVAVTAFSGQRSAAAEAGQVQPSAGDPTAATLTAIDPAPAAAAAEQLVAKKQVASEKPSPARLAAAGEGPRAGKADTPPPDAEAVASAQGHVARETEVASPESLRALVSRTQPPAPGNVAAAGARSAGQDDGVTPVAPAASPAEPMSAAVRRPQSMKPVSRSEGNARGLQSAAAALERVEQQPVESLLTRTLGSPAPNPVPAAERAAPTPVTKRTVARNAAAEADVIRRPAGWEDGEPLRLEPRHARPQTTTAPAPPLRLDSVGTPVERTSTAATTAGGAGDGGTAWVDPDGEDWAEAVTSTPTGVVASPETPRERIVRRLSQNSGGIEAAGEASPPPPAPEPPISRAMPAATDEIDQPPVKRLLEKLRPTERLRDRFGQRGGRSDPSLPQVASPQTAWPPPAELLRQLEALAAEASPRPAVYQEVGDWVARTTAAFNRVLMTAGPHAADAVEAVAVLADCPPAGMTVADRLADEDRASELRRVAFAVKRRAVTWQAAAALAAEWQAGLASQSGLAEAEQATVELVHLLAAIERFEADPRATQAAEVQQSVGVVADVMPAESGDIVRAISNQYAAPNFRVTLREAFLTLLMPETTSRAEAVSETVLGRPVRGRRVVDQKTSIQLTPDPDEICFNLVVDGEMSTYAITDTGPISMASRGTGRFTVQKPVKVCQHGLVVGPATASASNRARLTNVSTSFDSVPLMGSLLRTLARNQHAENLPAANREVAQKIIWQSCQQTDEESERKFAELAGLVEEKVWGPLVRLGLRPSPFMETTEEKAILRLRLHADAQLAAHTPRPREPENSLLGMQVHQSTLNNAFDRLNIGGHRLSLEDLFVRVQEQLGLEPTVPEDIPEGVSVTFEAVDPLRVEFTDGLVEVRVAIDALESGRRDWFDVVGRVSYKPVLVENRVLLEREGPIRIGGPGHRGRIEFALRTIFGKIFPKERPLPVLPERITEHPRLQELAAVQAVSWDGWFALALADTRPAQLETAAATGQDSAARR